MQAKYKNHTFTVLTLSYPGHCFFCNGYQYRFLKECKSYQEAVECLIALQSITKENYVIVLAQWTGYNDQCCEIKPYIYERICDMRKIKKANREV
jgi:hypothetical protein